MLKYHDLRKSNGILLRYPCVGKVSFCSKLKIRIKSERELLFSIIRKTGVELLRISTRRRCESREHDQILREEGPRDFKLVIAHLIVQMIFT